MIIPERNVWRFKSTNPYRTEVETYLQVLEKHGVWLDVEPEQGSHSGNVLNTFGLNNYMSNRYSFKIPISPIAHMLTISGARFMGPTVQVYADIEFKPFAGVAMQKVVSHDMLFGIWPQPERFMKDVLGGMKSHIDIVISNANRIL